MNVGVQVKKRKGDPYQEGWGNQNQNQNNGGWGQ
jgi:hypothetical protein